MRSFRTWNIFFWGCQPNMWLWRDCSWHPSCISSPRPCTFPLSAASRRCQTLSWRLQWPGHWSAGAGWTPPLLPWAPRDMWCQRDWALLSPLHYCPWRHYELSIHFLVRISWKMDLVSRWLRKTTLSKYFIFHVYLVVRVIILCLKMIDLKHPSPSSVDSEGMQDEDVTSPRAPATCLTSSSPFQLMEICGVSATTMLFNSWWCFTSPLSLDKLSDFRNSICFSAK